MASTLASILWNTDRYDNARRALDLCEQWTAAFPKYRNINRLVNLRNTITAKEASVKVSTLLYPGEIDSVRLSYRNVDSLTLRIYPPTRTPAHRHAGQRPEATGNGTSATAFMTTTTP